MLGDSEKYLYTYVYKCTFKMNKTPSVYDRTILNLFLYPIINIMSLGLIFWIYVCMWWYTLCIFCWPKKEFMCEVKYKINIRSNVIIHIFCYYTVGTRCRNFVLFQMCCTRTCLLYLYVYMDKIAYIQPIKCFNILWLPLN